MSLQLTTEQAIKETLSETGDDFKDVANAGGAENYLYENFYYKCETCGLWYGRCNGTSNGDDEGYHCDECFED